MSNQALNAIEQMWLPSAEARADMTLAQLEVQKDALRRALKRLENVQPCCNTCSRFDFVKTCNLHGEIPREFVSAIGQCPDWAFDAIPF